MIKRTTIIDQDLLNRDRKALGETTTRATVEEALRRVANDEESERSAKAEKQRRYLQQWMRRPDLAVLKSTEMWR